MPPSPLLTLEGVGKSFGSIPVLENLDLSVGAGEFVSFIGSSGSGKSTLLRLVAGLIEPTGGAIRVGGRTPREARAAMFFVFQEPSLLPWRRVAANVELPLEIRRTPAAERRARAAEMLRLVDLAEHAQKYPWQLSGGMKMRASLARALTLTPQLLLLDEPFGALDEMTRDRLNEDLLGLRSRSHFTALFVTHSVMEAVFLSNRVVVLSPSPGRIAVIIDVPFPYPRQAELREDPAFLRLVADTSRALRGCAPAP